MRKIILLKNKCFFGITKVDEGYIRNMKDMISAVKELFLQG